MLTWRMYVGRRGDREGVEVPAVHCGGARGEPRRVAAAHPARLPHNCSGDTPETYP